MPTDLAGLLAVHPSLRLAAPEDNVRILGFFERAPMSTSAFDVFYLRRPDFFRLLRLQSDRAFVVLDLDERGEVRGIGTISLRPGWADGRPTTIGYLGDLRIARGRTASRVWRAFFADLVSQAPGIREFADCTHWHTVILDGNLEARTALRPRAGRPTLVPIGPFTMRNLIMRLPLAGRHRAIGGWKISAAGPGHEGALQAFFEAENRQAHLGFRGEMARRISLWDGFSIGDFVHASDAQGIVACVAPWSPAVAKQTVVSRMPAGLRLLGLAAKAFPKPPLRVPARGERLRSPYLTHLTFAGRLTPDERADVFRAMVDFLFDRWRGADWHCISFCDFHAWNLGRALKGYVQQTVPLTVYAILSPVHSPVLSPIHSSVHSPILSPCLSSESEATGFATPPAFEMAMV
ncbi:MAG: hypothetical protein M3Y08_15700 [Fibrobacterota bacterium]|nr:hypothetical protein [Fibrobacterota bacterium]